MAPSREHSAHRDVVVSLREIGNTTTWCFVDPSLPPDGTILTVRISDVPNRVTDDKVLGLIQHARHHGQLNSANLPPALFSENRAILLPWETLKAWTDEGATAEERNAKPMKTGRLFEFVVEHLSAALSDAFASKAIRDFEDKEEVQCGGCLHETSCLYVVAKTKRLALREINQRKTGLCGNCMAELIAKEGWKIVSDGNCF